MIGDAWQQLLEQKRPGGRGKPKLLFGPICTGDKVIANGLIDEYREVWSKMIGVEMEAGGTAGAAFQAANTPGFFMIRGASDLADGAKDSSDVMSWRAYACDVAAAYTVALLRSGPVPTSQRAEATANPRQAHRRQRALRRWVRHFCRGLAVSRNGVAGPPPLIHPDPGTAEGDAKAQPAPLLQNLRHERNRNFTGREDFLARMAEYFATADSTAGRLALWGLGGVGKTHIANEYAYRHQSSYRLIWWVRSEDLGTLFDDIAALAVTLELAGAGSPERSSIVEAVRNALEERREWLLIFDNAENLDNLSDILPRRGGHVLITSRTQTGGN